MNLSSAILNKIIKEQDIETWSLLRKDYLPNEYHPLFKLITKHLDSYNELPSFADLKLSIRDKSLRDKVFTIEVLEIDTEAWILLDYLKNETAQKIILTEIENYLDNSIAMASAEENVDALHDIIITVQDTIDMDDPNESMQTIELFDSDEVLAKYLALGLNADFDVQMRFAPGDQIMIGGPRGSGKSLTCSNLAWTTYEAGRGVEYFTIEMPSRLMLQRICAIATGVPLTRLVQKNLQDSEWVKVAGFWASRFEQGEHHLNNYLEHRDFDLLHKELTKIELRQDRQIGITYDPNLHIGKIESVLDVQTRTRDVGLIIVDYINQVQKSGTPSKLGMFNWIEQIEVSKKLKNIAQKYDALLVTPYQVDAGGEARFAKGILDSCEIAWVIDPFTAEDACMHFECVKVRNGPKISFTSEVDWRTLKIGPASALTPKEKNALNEEAEESDDVPWREK